MYLLGRHLGWTAAETLNGRPAWEVDLMAAGLEAELYGPPRDGLVRDPPLGAVDDDPDPGAAFAVAPAFARKGG